MSSARVGSGRPASMSVGGRRTTGRWRRVWLWPRASPPTSRPVRVRGARRSRGRTCRPWLRRMPSPCATKAWTMFCGQPPSPSARRRRACRVVPPSSSLPSPRAAGRPLCRGRPRGRGTTFTSAVPHHIHRRYGSLPGGRRRACRPDLPAGRWARDDPPRKRGAEPDPGSRAPEAAAAMTQAREHEPTQKDHHAGAPLAPRRWARR